MKKVLLIAAACTTITSIADAFTNQMVKVGDKYFTREEVHQATRMASIALNGGIVRETGSAKGRFSILNAQKTVPEADIRPVLSVVDRDIRIPAAMNAVSNVTPQTVKGAIAALGGTVGVAIVEADGLPALLTAPEDGWSIVNVAALKTTGADGAALAGRVRKEVLRALAFVIGGAYTTRGDFLMRDVRRPEDLDALRREAFGVELVKRFEQSAEFYGIKPWRQASYRRACVDGWAPAPTNKFQTAIWNEVHALPSDPIKIKYDPKRDK